ncbi:hypothetical protein J6590_061545 [Homalodisca vitripennis]|nr:hypothetical protein J6590_061545 [Homalodisca vitripennis]
MTVDCIQPVVFWVMSLCAVSVELVTTGQPVVFSAVMINTVRKVSGGITDDQSDCQVETDDITCMVALEHGGRRCL